MSDNAPIIGVLALQGAVQPHKAHIEAAGGEFRAVKTLAQCEEVDGFILPGGESTTMLKLIERFELWDGLMEQFSNKPVWGICAGSILLATRVLYQNKLSSQRFAQADLNSGDLEIRTATSGSHVDPVRASAPNEARQLDDDGWLIQKSFGLLPITVQRNGYGRQLDSHYAVIDGYNVAFIRAPVFTEVGDDIEILAEHEGTPVWIKQSSRMATTFHPELTMDTPSPMHKMFIEMVKNA